MESVVFEREVGLCVTAGPVFFVDWPVLLVDGPP